MSKPRLDAVFTVLRSLVWALLLGTLAVSIALLTYSWRSRRREAFSRYDAAPKTGRFVKAGDVDLFIQEAGPAKGPALLLIHGLAGWSETWRETLDAAAARKMRAIAVDMPPLGYSQRPDDASYDDAAQAGRLLALLDALKLSRAAIVGHSFGARAAVALAVRAPKRVRALVIVDGALAAPGQIPAAPPEFLAALAKSETVRGVLLSATLANPGLTRKLLASFMADEQSATDARVAVLQRPLEVQGTVAAFGRLLERLATQPPSPAPDYRRIQAPTLILWGQADTTTPLALGAALQAAIKGSRLVVIPHAGHMLPLEAAPAFNAALLDFLAAGKRKK